MTVRDSQPSSRWVRAFVGDTVVVDSRDQLIVWEAELPVPRYVFHREDVLASALRPTTEPSVFSYHHPNEPVAEWFDLVVGDRVIEHAAWVRASLPDWIGVTWEFGVLDHWFEEAQEVVEHPHDPYVHIDALPSSRHVVVERDGVVLADSTSVVFLWETALPARYYFPREDVRFENLTPTPTTSICPYKGFANDYWDAPGRRNLAWSYPEPFFPYRNIAGRVAFLNEDVDITIDGVPQARPIPKVWPARSRLRS